MILIADPLRPQLGEVCASFGATRVKVTGIPGTDLDLPVHVERPARIFGKILDKDTGKPWPGRVSVLDSNGQYRHAKAYAGIATVSEKPVVFRPAWQKLLFFYSDGSFEVLLPSGTTMLSLERGCEHEIVRKRIDLSPGETVEVTLSSGRLVDMRTRGWISGDTHVHWCVNSWDENESPELLKVVQRAEDVRVVNNLTLYQWRPKKPFTKPDNAPPGPVAAVSDPDYIVHMGEEFRNDNHYGHINLLGITKLIHPISTGPGSGATPRRTTGRSIGKSSLKPKNRARLFVRRTIWDHFTLRRCRFMSPWGFPIALTSLNPNTITGFSIAVFGLDWAMGVIIRQGWSGVVGFMYKPGKTG